MESGEREAIAAASMGAGSSLIGSSETRRRICA
jgi:hypothetical protein